MKQYARNQIFTCYSTNRTLQSFFFISDHNNLISLVLKAKNKDLLPKKFITHKGAFRLDAKQHEATQSNQNLTSSTARERLRPLATFASSCATALACRQ